jgi:hypothetical protein
LFCLRYSRAGFAAVPLNVTGAVTAPVAPNVNVAISFTVPPASETDAEDALIDNAGGPSLSLIVIVAAAGEPTVAPDGEDNVAITVSEDSTAASSITVTTIVSVDFPTPIEKLVLL